MQFFMGSLATLSFSILFHTPAKQYLHCAFIGGAGWLLCQLLQQWGVSKEFSFFLATLLLTVLARLFSTLRRTPVTVYLLAGIFPLVPGAGIYYTVYALITSSPAMAAIQGVETLKSASAIVLGILFGFSLPQALFRRLSPSQKKED